MSAQVFGQGLHLPPGLSEPKIPGNVLRLLILKHALKVVEVDGLVGRGGEELSTVSGKRHSLHGGLMIQKADEGLPFAEVPDSDLSIVSTRDHSGEGEGALGEDADSV